MPLEPELGVRRRGGELPAPRGLRLSPGAARPLGLGSPRAHEGREGPVRAAHRGHGGAPRPLPIALREARALPRHARGGGRGRQAAPGRVLGARVWRLHRAYRFACSPFMAGFMELKHSERRQLKTAGSVVAEKVVKLTQNAIFGRCCMNPDKFRNTNAYVDPAKFERAVGGSSRR